MAISAEVLAVVLDVIHHECPVVNADIGVILEAIFALFNLVVVDVAETDS